jgi:hypothetical protein
MGGGMLMALVVGVFLVGDTFIYYWTLVIKSRLFASVLLLLKFHSTITKCPSDLVVYLSRRACFGADVSA